MSNGFDNRKPPKRPRLLPSVVLTVCVLCGLPGHARGDDAESAGALATRVIEAHAQHDAETVRRLASSSDPDPWLVARELVERRALDAADAFAAAAVRPETEPLVAWLRAVRRGDADVAVVDTARSDAEAGASLQKGRRYAESAAAYDRAARAARDLGWLAMASACFEQAARSLFREASFAPAREAAEAQLATEKALASAQGEGRALFLLGLIDSATGEHARAAERLERAAELAEATQDTEGRANALNSLGYLSAVRGARDEASRRWEEALRCVHAGPGKVRAARFRRDPVLHQRLVAQVLMNLGTLRFHAGAVEAARHLLDRATEAAEASGEPRAIAAAAELIGAMHLAAGERFEALAHYERALAKIETGNAPAERATILRRLGGLRRDLGDLPGALRVLQEAARVLADQGKRRDAAWALLELARTQRALGEAASALEACRRVAAEARALPDPPLEARAWLEIGALRRSRGAFSEAEDAYGKCLAIRKTLGKAGGVVDVLLRLGALADARGRIDLARAHLEEARRVAEAGAGDGRRRGDVEMAWGFHHAWRGEPNEAVEAFARAERHYAEAKDERDRARAMAARGSALRVSGRTEEAAAALQEALRILETVSDPLARARARMNLAIVRHVQARDEEALRLAQEALDDATAGGLLDAELECRWGLAALRQMSGDHEGALRAAEKALPLFDRLGRLLAEGEDAEVRRPYASVFEIGAVSAAALGRTESVYRFLEAGRARTLLKALGGRAALAEAVVSPTLRRREAAARATEALALARYTEARRGGVLLEIRERREALDAARNVLGDLLTAAQREERAGVDLVYPSTVPLAELRRALPPNDVLVLYGVFHADVLALVVAREGTRRVGLGSSATIRTSAESLLTTIRDGSARDVRAAAEDLRGRVVDPLELPEKTSRMLVSPDDVLARVPFALLVPEGKAVVQVPSASTYVRLHGDAQAVGEGVLAFGDPAYEGTLRRLPATRAEVEAIGTRVYVGAEATETRLREVARGAHRWRAVHFACHGLMDSKRPMLSSLALTSDASNDGLLTVGDVFRLRLPSDLAVLSGCETAAGEMVEGEGILGLARAFTFAGAPRVLCSMWKVDDEATRALMTRFYERFRPPDGTPGLGAAEALADAQAFVRAQPKWAHPRYWAPWVLWGVP